MRVAHTPVKLAFSECCTNFGLACDHAAQFGITIQDHVSEIARREILAGLKLSSASSWSTLENGVKFSCRSELGCMPHHGIAALDVFDMLWRESNWTELL